MMEESDSCVKSRSFISILLLVTSSCFAIYVPVIYEPVIYGLRPLQGQAVRRGVRVKAKTVIQ